MEKTCLNCKYEPDWSEWSWDAKAAHRYGRCKWSGNHMLPKAFAIKEYNILHYKNKDIGVWEDCPAYEPQ